MNWMKLTLPGLLAASALACGDKARGLEDPTHPTGSQTMALNAAKDAVVIAHPHEGVVSRVGLDGQLQELMLDGEPTRVTKAGNRYFVSLRQARSVAVLNESNGALVEETRIAVGPEPFGIVASEDGATVYVASALGGVVQEIDANTLTVGRSFEVEGEPRWLAYHPEGKVYAVSAWDGFISTIDLSSGNVDVQQMRTEQVVTGGRDNPDYRRRATGDPAVSPDGQVLAIPMLYANTSNLVAYYTAGPQTVVAEVPVQAGGDLDMGSAVFASVLSLSGGAVGYPSSVTYTHDGSAMLVSQESVSRVRILTTTQLEEEKDGFLDRVFSGSGFRPLAENRPMLEADTGSGPRSVVMLDDNRAVAFNFLDQTVVQLDLQNVRAQLDNAQPFDSFNALTIESVGPSTNVRLPADVEAGRRLFYSGDESRVSGGGVSCGQCHFDGRTDGFTWSFDEELRNTPSLAGRVSETAPVRWEGDRATVQDDARFTSQERMGGVGLDDTDLDNLAAFVDFTAPVDSPLLGMADPAVARGKAIFERPDVACASCHSGARYTDNQNYSMFGLSNVQTRSLTGLAGSPPYLHDGSAATLRDVIELSRDGSMGDTSSLSDAEVDDLIAYLRSL